MKAFLGTIGMTVERDRCGVFILTRHISVVKQDPTIFAAHRCSPTPPVECSLISIVMFATQLVHIFPVDSAGFHDLPEAGESDKPPQNLSSSWVVKGSLRIY